MSRVGRRSANWLRSRIFSFWPHQEWIHREHPEAKLAEILRDVLDSEGFQVQAEAGEEESLPAGERSLRAARRGQRYLFRIVPVWESVLTFDLIAQALSISDGERSSADPISEFVLVGAFEVAEGIRTIARNKGILIMDVNPRENLKRLSVILREKLMEIL